MTLTACMLNDPLCESAWLKWGWGCAHAKMLQRDCERFALDSDKQPFFTVRTDYHSHRHGFVVSVDSMQVFPPSWAAIVGDIANNFRSCLDHLAWALVESGRTPPGRLTDRQRKNIYFPIKSDRIAFNNDVGRMLPGVSRTHLAIVRRYQPYVAGKRKSRWHPFAVLADINDHDKHRTVKPVASLPAEATYEILEQRDCVVTGLPARARRRPLENGTELTVIRARKMGPQPYIEVKPSIPAKPTVAERAWLEDFINLVPLMAYGLLSEVSNAPVFAETLEFPV